MYKVAVVIVDRANYGRLKPVMQELARAKDKIQLQVVCAGSMVLERFGNPVEIIKKDGFAVDSELYIEIEGSNPTTMAKSLGFAVIEFSNELRRLKPDFLLVIGDRYEAFAATLAASYMNICIAHIQGGEVSGSIDESARHCMTKLAHYHFPATQRSADYIIRMGENPKNVFFVGCPSGDLARTGQHTLPPGFFNEHGLGAPIDSQKPFLLVVFHPVTTQYGMETGSAQHLLDALKELQHPTVWLWPNIDAGADHISQVIRSYFTQNDVPWLRLLKNLTPEDYLKVLSTAACAIGNSSSFVRDSSFFGTPVVLLGNRQYGREAAENVTLIDGKKDQIVSAIQSQLKHGKYPISQLYGDGTAAKKIVERLTSVRPYSQKNLYYVEEEFTSNKK